jgi:hypothetical protein
MTVLGISSMATRSLLAALVAEFEKTTAHRRGQARSGG